METTLVIVTLVSLGLAVSMSVVAWRLLHEERRRAAARVETLATLAAADDPEPVPVLLTAAAPLPAPAPRAADGWDAEFRRPDTLIERPVAMFDAVDEPGAPGRRWLALSAVGLLIGLGVGTLYALRMPDLVSAPAERAEPAIPSGRTAQPIELLSLLHSVNEAGAFTVTGFVQNPASAASLRGVGVVVYLFDQQGNHVATGRGLLDAATLEPGAQAGFAVEIPNTLNVSRFRVGFRSQNGAVVAHVDKRSARPTASERPVARPGSTPLG
jgi:hypothetical protein